MDTKLHRVYLENLLARPETAPVERVILDDLLRLLDGGLEKQPQQPADQQQCWLMSLSADTMRLIQRRHLSMTETLILALCGHRFYAFFHPLFRANALAYRERRATRADHKVATIGRTVSYRLPWPPADAVVTRAAAPEVVQSAGRLPLPPLPPSPYANETCFRCQRRGHITLDCPLGCRHCGRRGHTEGRCGTRVIGGVV